MREIKFRAWDEQEKQWFRFPFVVDSSGRVYREYIGGGKVERNIVLMQFTGLKDKNGKEIYEGDIVSLHHKLKSAMDFYKNMEVYRCTQRGEWRCESHNGAVNSMSLFGGLSGHGTNLEVIGNIYENPEILKP